MGAHFAKLMGNITAIEISFSKINIELNTNTEHYSNTFKYLTKSLDNLSILTSNLNEKNIVEIKNNFKNILQITKKELEQPLKIIKKNSDQMETNLHKIMEQIKSYNDKSQQSVTNSSQKLKIIITAEENLILENAITQLSDRMKIHKQELDLLLDNLMIVKDKISNIHKPLEQCEHTKEEEKIIKHMTDFIKKLPSTQYTITENTSILLQQLDFLKNMIAQSNVITHQMPDSCDNMAPDSLDNSATLPATLLTQFQLKVAIDETFKLDAEPTLHATTELAELTELDDAEPALQPITDLATTDLSSVPSTSPKTSPKTSPRPV